MLRRRLKLIAVGLSLGACSDGGITEHLGTSQAAISGGERDAEHTAVYRMLTRKDGRNGICSAVLIAPNLMLTAQHCVANTPGESVRCGEHPFGDLLPLDNILFSNDVQPTLNSDWLEAKEIRVPELNADLCGNDIALVVLEQALPEATSPQSESGPAPYFAPRLDTPAAVEENYLAVGYGENDADEGVRFGERRRRGGLVIRCAAGQCRGAVTPEEFGGDQGVCGGDSGGPALSADLEVLGVVSRGSDPCETPVYSAVEPWADWLRSEGKRAARDGAYEALPWMLTEAELALAEATEDPEPEPPDPALEQPEPEEPTLSPESGCALVNPRPGSRPGDLRWAIFLIAIAHAIGRRSTSKR